MSPPAGCLQAASVPRLPQFQPQAGQVAQLGGALVLGNGPSLETARPVTAWIRVTFESKQGMP